MGDGKPNSGGTTSGTEGSSTQTESKQENTNKEAEKKPAEDTTNKEKEESKDPPPENNNPGTKSAGENGEARGGSNTKFGRSNGSERRDNLKAGKGAAIIDAATASDPTGRGRDKEKQDKEANAAAAEQAMKRTNALTGNTGKLPSGDGISPELRKAVELAKERKKTGEVNGPK